MSETTPRYGVTAICVPPKDALSQQVGGDHYKDMAIQPMEFCMRNDLNFCQSSAIKYICR